MSKLSPEELERYDRQMNIQGWGQKSQERLKSSKVLVVGVGGLGCPVSLYLAAAGVGHLILVDRGRFELSNLNRQILGQTSDIGRLKVEVAKERLLALNPEITVDALAMEITDDNAKDLVHGVDVVVDCLDNWRTRFILNEACVREKRPLIHAGVSEFHGQLTTIIPGKTPCLRCIFPENPPERERIPVLGATPALLASLEVMETIKLITGTGTPLAGKLLYVDGKDMDFAVIEVKKNPNCTVCGNV